MKSENIKELAIALSKVQSEIVGAKRDSTNPFFESTYANLQSVWDACREPLIKNGFSIAQFMEGECLITILMHSSGEWIEGRYPIKPVKPDPQSMGSAISYARRYSLAAMVGIYQVDDDAETAQGRAAKETQMQKDLVNRYFEPISDDDYSPTPIPPPMMDIRKEADTFAKNMTKSVPSTNLHKHNWRPSKNGKGQFCSAKLPDGSWCKETK